MKKPPNSFAADCRRINAPADNVVLHEKQKYANLRSRLETLLDALDASLTALRLDGCGNWAIIGKLGHIYIDGRGFLLCISTGESARRWFNVKQRLSFCRLTQDGDDEGCLHLDRLPTAIEAKAIRKALGIRKRRHLSPASMAQAISALRLKPEPR